MRSVTFAQDGSRVVSGLVIVMGNPGVTAHDPYPTRGNPYPSTWVEVSAGRGRGLVGFFVITTGCGFTAGTYLIYNSTTNFYTNVSKF